jgi:hypothetical protein
MRGYPIVSGAKISAVSIMAAVACACVGLAEDKPVATNESGFVLSLSDGTSLVCIPQMAAMPVKTSYAAMEVPFDKIATVKVDKDKKLVVLKLMNGDQLQGETSLESIKVHTLIGDFVIPMAVVKELASAREVKPKYEDTPQRRNACINNLRMIDAGKEQWAMVARKSDGDPVDVRAVCEYIKGGTIPICPSGGTYKFGPIGANPECSVPGHAFNGNGGNAE